MQGYICGIADNSRTNYCPLCGEALGINAYYGDGNVVCDECDFHFAVIECEEKEQDVEEETRWIPCSERLPKTGEYVLISCEGFDVPSVGKYEENDIGGTFYLREDVPCEDFGIAVEAWRPLPEPYKE